MVMLSAFPVIMYIIFVAKKYSAMFLWKHVSAMELKIKKVIFLAILRLYLTILTLQFTIMSFYLTIVTLFLSVASL